MNGYKRKPCSFKRAAFKKIGKACMSGRVLREGFPFFSVALDSLGVLFLLALARRSESGVTVSATEQRSYRIRVGFSRGSGEGG